MSPLVGAVIPAALARFMAEYPTISVSLDIRGRRDIDQWAPGSQFEVGFVHPAQSITEMPNRWCGLLSWS